MTKPDFEALRAARNEAVHKHHEKLAKEFGVSVDSIQSTFDPNECYCACNTNGPCEHKWDGPDWESDDGCCFSVTCSRCGMTAMSHSLRTGL